MLFSRSQNFHPLLTFTCVTSLLLTLKCQPQLHEASADAGHLLMTFSWKHNFVNNVQATLKLTTSVTAHVPSPVTWARHVLLSFTFSWKERSFVHTMHSNAQNLFNSRAANDFIKREHGKFGIAMSNAFCWQRLSEVNALRNNYNHTFSGYAVTHTQLFSTVV